MNYELYEQEPDLFFLILLISLAITVFAYGAFPLIFAKTRNKPIAKKKYKLLCYGINAAVMCMFCVINCAISIGPYLLWTWAFSSWGAKILESREVLLDGEDTTDESDEPTECTPCKPIDINKTRSYRVTECISCGYRDKDFFVNCPKCGNNTRRFVYLNEDENINYDKISFCRKCGEKLKDNSQFCSKCGTKIIEE